LCPQLYAGHEWWRLTYDMNVPETHQVYPNDVEFGLLRELNCVTYTVDGELDWLPEKDWELPYKMLEDELAAAQKAHEREREKLSIAEQQGAIVRERSEEFRQHEKSLKRSNVDPREWSQADQDQIKETRERLAWELGVQKTKEMLIGECGHIAYVRMKVFREKLEKAREARQDEVETAETQVDNQREAHQNEDTGRSGTQGRIKGPASDDARKVAYEALQEHIKNMRSRPKRKRMPDTLRELEEEEEREAIEKNQGTRA
jgi:hypothetical protein